MKKKKVSPNGKESNERSSFHGSLQKQEKVQYMFQQLKPQGFNKRRRKKRIEREKPLRSVLRGKGGRRKYEKTSLLGGKKQGWTVETGRENVITKNDGKLCNVGNGKGERREKKHDFM